MCLFNAIKDTTLYVEGLDVSSSVGAEKLTLNWEPPAGLALAPLAPAAQPGAQPTTKPVVDFAKFTVADFLGPQNVPSYSIYTYKVKMPPNDPSKKDSWSVDGGEISSQGADGATTRVLWDKEPKDPTAGWIGKVHFTPAPGFTFERDVNVVQIGFSHTASLNIVAQGAPFQTGGAGSALIDSSNVADPNDATSSVAVFLDGNGNGKYDKTGESDDALLVDAHGPVVDGTERGLHFMDMGFAEQAEVTAKHGDYLINGKVHHIVSQAEDGKTHWGGGHWIGGLRFYRPVAFMEKAGGTVKHPLYWTDGPRMYGTDPGRFDWQGAKVQSLNLIFKNHTDFAVATEDRGVLEEDTGAGGLPAYVQTIRLYADWTFNGSGSIDPTGTWKPIPNQTGVTTVQTAFSGLTDGSRVPTAEDDVQQIWDNWKEA